MAPFNGSGTFNLVYNWEQDAINNIKIRADRMDGQEQDMANGLTDCITRDGQSPAMADIPMGGFSITGMADGQTPTSAATVGQVQNSASLYAVAAGTSDAITASFVPTITALVDGLQINVKANQANLTTTPTLNVDGLGASSIKRTTGQPLYISDIATSGFEMILRWSTSNNSWQLLNPAIAIPDTTFIINGDMRVDQRNAGAAQTITAAAAAAYTVDRFYASCTGANVTGQQVTGTGAYPKDYRFTGAASNTGIAFGTRIESVDSLPLSSGSYSATTLCFQVQMSASINTTVTYAVLAPTATDNWSSTTTITTSTINVTTTPTIYTVTFGPNAGFANGLGIQFSVSALGSGGTWRISGLKLDPGAYPTPFIQTDYAGALTKCQRYYQALKYSAQSLIAIGNSFSTTNAFCMIPFLPMRAAPTATLPTAGTAAGSAVFLTSTAGTPTAGSHSLTVANASGNLRLDASGYVGLTNGGASALSVSTSAAILLNAEL